jgi:hypothetical protein
MASGRLAVPVGFRVAGGLGRAVALSVLGRLAVAVAGGLGLPVASGRLAVAVGLRMALPVNGGLTVPVPVAGHRLVMHLRGRVPARHGDGAIHHEAADEQHRQGQDRPEEGEDGPSAGRALGPPPAPEAAAHHLQAGPPVLGAPPHAGASSGGAFGVGAFG